MQARRIWYCLRSLLLGSLCASASCQKPAAGPPIAARDDSRAHLRLDQIKPAPPLPEDVAAPPFEPAPQALRYLHSGQSFFDQRLWADATTDLEKSLQIEPRLAEARILLARAALQQGNTSLAESQLNEAMKIRPRDPAIHRLLGEIALQARRYDDAIASFRTALRAGASTPMRPEVVLAHLSLALALKESGYLQAAADELRAYSTATIKPTDEMQHYPELKEVILLYRTKIGAMMGEIHMKLGEYGRAVEDYQLAVAENPDDQSLAAQLAEALARDGRAAEAIEHVRRILKERPDDKKSLELLKDVCDIIHDPSRFDAELVELARQVDSPALQTRLAKMLLDRKKTAEAAAVLKRLVETRPDDTEAAYLLVRLSFDLKDWRTGLDLIAKALQRFPQSRAQSDELLQRCPLPELSAWAAGKPDDAVAQYLRAAGEYHQHDFPAALASAKASLQRDEKFGPAQVLLAALALRDHRWVDAKKLAQSAIDDGFGDAQAYLIKGAALESLDEDKDAETSLLESFRLDRKSAAPHFILGESAERRGDILRCEQIYRRIVDDVDPKHVQARERLVRLLLNTQKFDKAREYFSDFERLGLTGAEYDRCGALMSLANRRGQQGPERLNEYRDALAKIIEKYPKDPATYVELAMSYEAVGEFAKALKEIESALQVAPDDLRALERKVRYQVKLLDFDGASQTTAAYLQLRPRDADWMQRKADLALSRGEFDEAIGLFKTLMARDDLKDRREMYISRLLGILRFAHRGDEAVQVAQEWLDSAPSDPGRREVYLDALQIAERRDDAIDAARRWLSADPTNTDLRVQYIDQLISAKRYVEGEQRVLDWLSKDADDLNLNRLLLRLFWAARQWDSAIDLARTGMEISEQRSAYEALLGVSYRLARRYDEAIEFYRDRAAGPAAARTLIEVLIEAERFGEAEKLATRALMSNPTPGMGADLATVLNMRNYLVRIYQLGGRENQAAQQLEEILKILPPDSGDPRAPYYDRYVGIQNDLGYTWVDAGTHLDKAEEMIRFAVSEKPTVGAYVDSFGWLLYKRGRFDEAVVQLRRAILLTGSQDAVLFDHLADALYRDGKADEAKATWDKALAVPAADDDDRPNAEDRRVRARIKAKLDALKNHGNVEVAPIAGEKPSSRPAEHDDSDDDQPSNTLERSREDSAVP